jgi:hypothetical protein
MAVFPKPKPIKSSDFPKEYEELTTALGNVLNDVLDQTYFSLNRGIDFNNLNQKVVSFSVKVGSNGVPSSPLSIKSDLKTKVQGTQCIRVLGTSFPLSNPLLSYNYNSTTNSIDVTHITGLSPGVAYTLTVILIG